MTEEKKKSLLALAVKFATFGIVNPMDDEEAKKKAAEAEAAAGKDKFETVQIKDGETMIDYNPSLEIGTPVNVAGGNGSAPAPDGKVELSNGIVFMVKDGVIESVIDNGELNKNKAPEIVEMSAQIVALEKEVKDLKEMFSKIDFTTIPTIATVEAFSKDVKDFGTTLGQAIEEFDKIPVNVPKSEEAEPDKTQAINFAAVADMFTKQKAEQE